MKANIQETVLIADSIVVMPGGVWPVDLRAVSYADTLVNRWADEQLVAITAPCDGNALVPVQYAMLCEISGGMSEGGHLALSLRGVARAQVVQLGAKGPDGLFRAKVVSLQDKPVPADINAPEDLERFVQSTHEKLGSPWNDLKRKEQHAAHWLSNRLLELLPVDLLPIDRLISENDPLERLKIAISILGDKPSGPESRLVEVVSGGGVYR